MGSMLTWVSAEMKPLEFPDSLVMGWDLSWFVYSVTMRWWLICHFAQYNPWGGAQSEDTCAEPSIVILLDFFFLACWKDLDAGAHCKSNRLALSPNSYVNSQSTRLIRQRLKVNLVKGGWVMILKKTYASLQGLVSLYSFVFCLHVGYC